MMWRGNRVGRDGATTEKIPSVFNVHFPMGQDGFFPIFPMGKICSCGRNRQGKRGMEGATVGGGQDLLCFLDLRLLLGHHISKHTCSLPVML